MNSRTRRGGQTPARRSGICGEGCVGCDLAEAVGARAGSRAREGRSRAAELFAG